MQERKVQVHVRVSGWRHKLLMLTIGLLIVSQGTGTFGDRIVYWDLDSWICSAYSTTCCFPRIWFTGCTAYCSGLTAGSGDRLDFVDLGTGVGVGCGEIDMDCLCV